MIPIFKPKFYQSSKELAIQAINKGDIAQGPFIKEFEDKFSSTCNRLYGVTCSNGTVALYMAIKALNLPKGSEVILPSMTIVSCLTAIKENNLIPVFCDVDPKTYNIDFNSVDNKISEKTSAIIVVNTYGLMVDVDKLINFKKNNPHIKVIEDASESHGATYKDYKAGSLGDISTFSFYTNKIVSMGEGGIVLTNNPSINYRLRQIKNLNFINRKKYIHEDFGFNFRLTNIQCALGLGQLDHIKETIKHRKRVANYYNKLFKENNNIQTPLQPKGYNNVYWYYAIIIKSNYNKVLENLNKSEIDYRHFFYPLHKQPFINSSEILINSQKCFERGILLPIFNELTEQQIQHIVSIIKKSL